MMTNAHRIAVCGDGNTRYGCEKTLWSLKWSNGSRDGRWRWTHASRGLTDTFVEFIALYFKKVYSVMWILYQNIFTKKLCPRWKNKVYQVLRKWILKFKSFVFCGITFCYTFSFQRFGFSCKKFEYEEYGMSLTAFNYVCSRQERIKSIFTLKPDCVRQFITNGINFQSMLARW